MRKLGDKLLVLLAALTVSLLWSFALAGDGGHGARAPRPVSELIFPDQELPVRFSHLLHLTRVDAECEDCHVDIARSGSALDNNMPREEACAACHAIDRRQPDKAETGRPPAACSACHVGFQTSRPVARIRLGTPMLKFGHRQHLARGARCSDCHGDFVAEGVGLATRAQLPRMATCLGCHDGRKAPSTCTTCHLSDPGGVVKTRLPGGVLAPSDAVAGAAHDLNFRTSHRFAAQNNEALCASCHKKDFCVDCHNGVVKPMDFHGGDYVRMHAIDARRNQPDCSSCHRAQSFCVGCHSRSGVANDGKGSELVPPSAGDGPRFHPSGWVEFAPSLVEGDGTRGANHHAFQAQRNIRQCAACHRESFCTGCHSAQMGAPRINPHPRNWLGSARCRALVARAGRMCLRCHTELSEVDCDRPAMR